jgi:outer membrane lipopolysaccharide assembly protein LptE/RlpB
MKKTALLILLAVAVTGCDFQKVGTGYEVNVDPKLSIEILDEYLAYRAQMKIILENPDTPFPVFQLEAEKQKELDRIIEMLASQVGNSITSVTTGATNGN